MASVPAILVPVDGSDQSMQTIRYLARFLSPQHVNLELFHVATDLPETFFDLNEIEGTAAYGAELGEWRRDRRLRLERFLNEAIGVLVDAGAAGAVHGHARQVNHARDATLRCPRGNGSRRGRARGCGPAACARCEVRRGLGPRARSSRGRSAAASAGTARAPAR